MRAFKELDIPGVYEIDLFHAGDARGVFVKTLHKSTLEEHGLIGDFQESFYSVNQRGVIRGMHFQHPPHDHAKIVYCTSGSLIDVILDIRVGSPTYGKAISVPLSGENFKAVYLPKGMAHGFAVLDDHTCMVYLTSTMHAPQSDDGILCDSIDFDWPIKEPIRSQRDQDFTSLDAFQSPFIYG